MKVVCFTQAQDPSVDLVIAGLTHDVRGALHAIKLLGLLARRRLRRGDVEGTFTALQRLDGAVTKGAELCGDTLECSRRAALSSSMPAPTLVDLVDVVRESAGLVEGIGNQIILHTPDVAQVLSHRRFVERILSNLLRNAACHGVDKPIDVHVHLGSRGATISVRDYGAGIPGAALERLAIPYACGEGSDVSFERFGLGLWIARSLAGALGGALHIASEVGRGTAATLYLPAPALLESSSG